MMQRERLDRIIYYMFLDLQNLLDFFCSYASHEIATKQ